MDLVQGLLGGAADNLGAPFMVERSHHHHVETLLIGELADDFAGGSAHQMQVILPNALVGTQLCQTLACAAGHFLDQRLGPGHRGGCIGNEAGAGFVCLKQVQLRFTALRKGVCRLQDAIAEFLDRWAVLGQFHSGNDTCWQRGLGMGHRVEGSGNDAATANLVA